MEHTEIVNATELEAYADMIGSQATIPELIYALVNASVPDLTICRIPYGTSVSQPGLDGQVQTDSGFHQFVPKKRSFWEIGTGNDPQSKATIDFNKRTAEIPIEIRKESGFVFVTPRAAGSGGWNEPNQRLWTETRANSGWGRVIVLDGVQIAAWLREFPAIGMWLLRRMGHVKTMTGFTIPTEHWENLEQLSKGGEPRLPSKLFTVGKERACSELLRLFRGETKQMAMAGESENDVEDFVAAWLASLEANDRTRFCNACLFVKDDDAWMSMSNLKAPHVLVGHQNLDLESSGEQLELTARRKEHAVIISVSGGLGKGNENLFQLRSPSASVIETVLFSNGYTNTRAKELASAGALSLAALKRHLRGLGTPPPYASWEHARQLAEAGLFGRWSGENPSDKLIMESLLGKSYGEWIKILRGEALRSDTPLTQRNENWKIISRTEAWLALGSRLTNEDLDKLGAMAINVLGERDPQFDLKPEERFSANILGKALKYSGSLRAGIAESLALLGSRPEALSSCSQGKAQRVAGSTVEALLKDADWTGWASVERQLPLLAEAAPHEFLAAVENAMLDPKTSSFNELFSQERSGITGRNYTTGLLWALETLAWNADFLQRVTILLGELAGIDPGGQWANRAANSLSTIFLPWHPQTTASIAKRKSAIESLLKEQPLVGWKLLGSLLPSMHGFTMGSHKPTWRQFIPTEWPEGVTKRDYDEQVSGYAALAIGMAKQDLSKLTELIDRLPDLPREAHSRVLAHFVSQEVLSLSEASRLPIWEALVDLASKHRKFKEAKWAMAEKTIAQIEDVARRIAPTSPMLLYRRLFSDRDWELFEDRGSHEDQEADLNLRRQTAIATILDASNIEGLFDFARQVTSPEKVGSALGTIECSNAHATLLPRYLDNDDAILKRLTAAFILRKFWTKGWPWADELLNKAWTKPQRITFFALLPFTQETWRRAEANLGSDAEQYWKRTQTNPYGPPEHLLEATERLLLYGRPQAALLCLIRLVHQSVNFSPVLALQVLTDVLSKPENASSLDYHDAIQIIDWLQKHPDTNQDALFKIEWNYLPFLDRHLGSSPITIEKRLASDPSLFCEMIGILYKSDKDGQTDRQYTERQQNVAQNAYRLLDGWHTIPGSTQNGTFDGEALKQWVNEVYRLTETSGHVRVAMKRIGQTLSHAPPDADGFWIHRSVADVLDEKPAVELRRGFVVGLLNMRGVHTFTGGNEERSLAEKYRGKADALENNGYHRVGASIRDVVRMYEEEAERESKRDPFED